MKTLTELSGALIRMAANAVAEVKKSFPEEEQPSAPVESAPAAAAAAEVPAAKAEPAAADGAAEAKPAEAAPAEAAEAAPAEAGAAEAKPAEAGAAEAKPAEAKPAEEKPVEKAPVVEVESDALKAALDEAVGKATGLSGDRLARLREALKAVGKRATDVRLVRVFGPEEKVEGAAAIGGFQYVVDLSPANMKQVMTLPEKGRGGKGGRPGAPRPNAGTTGGFSMDSVIQDRQNERGRFGGGRSGAKRPGSSGGRPPGGKGRPPGGGRGP